MKDRLLNCRIIQKDTVIKAENEALQMFTKECGQIAVQKLTNQLSDFKKAQEVKDLYLRQPRRAREEKPSGTCEFTILTQGKWPV